MSTEFDSYATAYESVHNQNLASFGAESREFLHAKLVWCARYAARQFQSITTAKNFLDYGCGIGRFGHEFYTYFDQSWKYVGVDPSQASIREARDQSTAIMHLLSQPTKTPLFLSLDSWHPRPVEYNFILAACMIDPFHPGDHKLGSKGIAVTAFSIDDLLAARGWPLISLIKIDVQGAEARVIAGAMESIRRFHPALFIEIDDVALKLFNTSANEVFTKLKERYF